MVFAAQFGWNHYPTFLRYCNQRHLTSSVILFEAGVYRARNPRSFAPATGASALDSVALDLDDDDVGDRRALRARGLERDDSVGTGRHRDGLLLGIDQQVGRLDLVLEARQIEAGARRREDGEVELGGLRRAAPIGAIPPDPPAIAILDVGEVAAELLAERRAARAVHCFAVGLQPLPDLAQDLDAALWNHAVGHGTHVEQVVPALAHNVHELEDDLTGAFPVVIVLLVAPGVIDGRGRFPRVLRTLVGDGVVAGSPVVAFLAGHAKTAVDQAVGLDGADDVDEALAALRRHHARRVEPYEADRAVVGQDLAHLGLGLVAEILVVVLSVVRTEVPGVAGAVGFVPVLRLRVIEAEAHPLARAGLG